MIKGKVGLSIQSADRHTIMKQVSQPIDNDDNSEIDQEISQLVARIRQQQAQMEQLDLEVTPLKERLGKLLRQRGENWSDDSGYARLVTESVRTYYDTHNLDELILTDPLHYGWLRDYRRQSIVPQRIQVR
jgi:hypothetical protein